jgi:hypothetical protein
MVLAARCLVCRREVNFNPKALTNHLKNEHSDLIKVSVSKFKQAQAQRAEKIAADSDRLPMDSQTSQKPDQEKDQRDSDGSDSDILTVPLKTLRQLKEQEESSKLLAQEDYIPRRTPTSKPGIRDRLATVAGKHAKSINMKSSSSTSSRGGGGSFLEKLHCMNCEAFKRPILKSHAKSVAAKSSLLATIWTTCCDACIAQTPYQDLFCTDCVAQVGVFNPEKQQVFALKSTTLDS